MNLVNKINNLYILLHFEKSNGTSEITPPNTGVVETPNESNQAFYLSGFALLALFLLKKRYEG